MDTLIMNLPINITFMVEFNQAEQVFKYYNLGKGHFVPQQGIVGLSLIDHKR